MNNMKSFVTRRPALGTIIQSSIIFLLSLSTLSQNRLQTGPLISSVDYFPRDWDTYPEIS